MPKTKTTKFDAATYLTSEADVAAYLQAALDEHDPAFFVVALGTAARARGMSRIAAKSKLGRESLYKAFRAGADPHFTTVLRVLGSLGVRLQVAPQPRPERARRPATRQPRGRAADEARA